MAKRRPSVERWIKELKEGGRAAIAGLVVAFEPEKGEGIIDDGTGTITFVLEDLIFAEDIREGSFVRLLGRVVGTERGLLFRAEIANKLNVRPTIYNKVKELERRYLS